MPVEEKKIDKSIGLLNDVEIGEICSHYNFYNWQIVPFISMNNEVIDFIRKTETSRKLILKVNDKVFFLKEIPWYCSKKDFVEYELNFQNFLNLNSLPVPKIIQNKNKKFFTSLNYGKGEKFYFLQNFVFGDSFSNKKTEVKNSAIFLAKFHKISKDFDISKYSKFEESISDLASDMLSLSKNTLNEKISKTEFKEDFNQFQKLSKKILAESKIKLEAQDYFKYKQPVHGDFNPSNLIFKNSKVKGVIDFDNSCIDNPIHDLAEALVHFSFLKYKKHSSLFKNEISSFNESLFNEFIKAYLDEFPENKLIVQIFLKDSLKVVLIELLSLALICGDFSYDKISEINSFLSSLDKNLKFIDSHLK